MGETVNKKRYVVPEGMLEAVNNASEFAHNLYDEVIIEMLSAALRWLAENPIVPTDGQILAEAKDTRGCDAAMYVQWIAWWQRRMFLAPEPEIPEAVKDMLYDESDEIGPAFTLKTINGEIIEAYQRGRKDRS